jgi:hypothetical protein
VVAHPFGLADPREKMLRFLNSLLLLIMTLVRPVLSTPDNGPKIICHPDLQLTRGCFPQRQVGQANVSLVCSDND